jgi:hypothetical protein
VPKRRKVQGENGDERDRGIGQKLKTESENVEWGIMTSFCA